MKKGISLLSLGIIMSASAMAEGYQVNLLSAKQAGMGHVGVAMKLGAESMHFNPAGLGFLEGTVDVSAGVSGIMSKATYENGNYSASTDNKISTPMYAYAGFRINDYLKAGVAVTTPYGSSLNWGKNWAGASLVQDISLQSFSFQPTISWKITDNLSIGAGAMIFKGNFSLSRAIMPASSLAFLGPSADGTPGMGALIPGYNEYHKEHGNDNHISTTLSGNSKIGVGYNVGIMWDINDKWSLGASYRSNVNMKVSNGKAELQYADEKAFKQILATVNAMLQGAGQNPIVIPPLDKGTFKAQLPLPSNLTVGASYRPNNKLQFALDLQMVGWGVYESLDVKFTEEVLGGYSINAEKNYKNTMTARLGAEYAVSPRWDLRAGVYFDQTPVQDNYYNPETPGMSKVGTSVGFSYEAFSGFSIDFSALYIAGISREGSYTSPNPLTGKDDVFKGKYGTSAFAPSIGLSYNF